MIFYHGTTLDAARSIQREGLIPHRTSAYHLKDEIRGVILRKLAGENKPYIYLQSNLRIARDYARFRAMYERAKYGQTIDIPSLQPMVKTARKRNQNAKPALITLDVPSTIAASFKIDPQNWDGGHVCLCVIPAKYIKEVQSV